MKLWRRREKDWSSSSSVEFDTCKWRRRRMREEVGSSSRGTVQIDLNACGRVPFGVIYCAMRISPHANRRTCTPASQPPLNHYHQPHTWMGRRSRMDRVLDREHRHTLNDMGLMRTERRWWDGNKRMQLHMLCADELIKIPPQQLNPRSLYISVSSSCADNNYNFFNYCVCFSDDWRVKWILLWGSSSSSSSPSFV